MVKFNFKLSKPKENKPKVDNKVYDFIKKGESIFINGIEYRKIKDKWFDIFYISIDENVIKYINKEVYKCKLYISKSNSKYIKYHTGGRHFSIYTTKYLKELFNKELLETYKDFIDIKGYNGLYKINNKGEVLSLNNGYIKKMTPCCNTAGYLYVILSNNGIKKNESIHRLVAKHFIDNPNNYPEVNHIDENKFNNNVSNLEWCTSKYNSDYSNGKKVKVTNIITKEEKIYNSQRDIERLFNRSYDYIHSAIINNKIINDKYILSYE